MRARQDIKGFACLQYAEASNASQSLQVHCKLASETKRMLSNLNQALAHLPSNKGTDAVINMTERVVLSTDF